VTAGTGNTVDVDDTAPGDPLPPDDTTLNGDGGGGVSADPDAASPAKILIGLVGMLVVGWFVINASLSFAYYPEWFADSKILIGLLALVVGLGGAFLFFYFVNMFV